MLTFNNNENKSLVWELLYKNHIFDNISESYTDNIKQLIDNTIIEISNNNEYKNYPVLELNKTLIARVTSSIRAFKNQNNINKEYNNIKKDYNSVLVNNAETMKLEMNEILQVKKPPEPVFKDDQVDKYNNINIDNELQKLINERNKYQNIIPDINKEIVQPQQPYQQPQQPKDTINDNITLVYDKTIPNEQNQKQNQISKSKLQNIEDIFTENISTPNISTENISTLNNTPSPPQDNREKIIELLYDIQKKQNIIINMFNNMFNNIE